MAAEMGPTSVHLLVLSPQAWGTVPITAQSQGLPAPRAILALSGRADVLLEVCFYLMLPENHLDFSSDLLRVIYMV